MRTVTVWMRLPGGVVGSVAGVVGAAAAVVFGLLPLLRDRQARKEISLVAAPAAGWVPAAGGGDDVLVVGEIPQELVAFRPRASGALRARCTTRRPSGSGASWTNWRPLA